MTDQHKPTRPDDARDIARDLRTLASAALPHTADLLREAATELSAQAAEIERLRAKVRDMALSEIARIDGETL